MEIEGIRIDDTVDITDKVCPLTFVKAKVAIDEFLGMARDVPFVENIRP